MLGSDLFRAWGGWNSQRVEDPLWGAGWGRLFSWRVTAARESWTPLRCRVGWHLFRNPFPGTAYRSRWCDRCGKPGWKQEGTP